MTISLADGPEEALTILSLVLSSRPPDPDGKLDVTLAIKGVNPAVAQKPVPLYRPGGAVAGFQVEDCVAMGYRYVAFQNDAPATVDIVHGPDGLRFEALRRSDTIAPFLTALDLADQSVADGHDFTLRIISIPSMQEEALLLLQDAQPDRLWHLKPSAVEEKTAEAFEAMIQRRFAEIWDDGEQ